jgi:hypothetical protein
MYRNILLKSLAILLGIAVSACGRLDSSKTGSEENTKVREVSNSNQELSSSISATFLSMLQPKSDRRLRKIRLAPKNLSGGPLIQTIYTAVVCTKYCDRSPRYPKTTLEGPFQKGDSVCVRGNLDNNSGAIRNVKSISRGECRKPIDISQPKFKNCLQASPYSGLVTLMNWQLSNTDDITIGTIEEAYPPSVRSSYSWPDSADYTFKIRTDEGTEQVISFSEKYGLTHLTPVNCDDGLCTYNCSDGICMGRYLRPRWQFKYGDRVCIVRNASFVNAMVAPDRIDALGIVQYNPSMTFDPAPTNIAEFPPVPADAVAYYVPIVSSKTKQHGFAHLTVKVLDSSAPVVLFLENLETTLTVLVEAAPGVKIHSVSLSQFYTAYTRVDRSAIADVPVFTRRPASRFNVTRPVCRPSSGYNCAEPALVKEARDNAVKKTIAQFGIAREKIHLLPLNENADTAITIP